MRHISVAPFAALILLMGTELAAQPLIEDFVPVTDEMLQDPDPADWLMWRRTLNNWGYSPLDQIGKRNVGSLQL
ncbi:MAG: pyrroloquinoline quinone-dependent dehydrogenase, partial [Gammaproteobacteria bacterium]